MKFKSLTAMLDVSRNSVLKVDQIEHFIDLAAKMGYDSVALYTEDLYEMPEYPLFGYQRGRYSKQDLKHLVDYGRQKGITMVPCIEILAHLQHIFRWDEFLKYRDTDDILLADDPRTYELVECMLKTAREIYDTDYLVLCCDESAMLGRGKFLDRSGYEDAKSIFFRHVDRCIELAHKYRFTPNLDYDMYFTYVAGTSRVENASPYYDKITDKLPENTILSYWDYSPSPTRAATMLEACRRFGSPVCFITSVMNWAGFVSHNRQAIHWQTNSLIPCLEGDVERVIVSAWGDDGGECSVFSCLPAWFHAARMCHGITDPDTIKSEFRDVFGMDFDDFCKLDYGTDYTGEINFFSEKPMIFNDPFMGIYDIHVPEDRETVKNRFLAHAKELRVLSDHAEFGYLFDTTAALCELMSLKMDLGIRTREAYGNRDMDAISVLIEDYETAACLAETFYGKFRELWLRERKANGFEVQTVRYGGLITRLRDCRLRLLDLAEGRIDRIEELEEPILENNTGAGLKDKRYGEIVTVNSLTHFNFYGF